MKQNISIHLVIIGNNPADNEFSLALIETDGKIHTIQGTVDKEPDIIACDYATKFIDAPLDWYSVRKQTFITSEDGVHLIYVVTIPINVKLKKNIKWYPIYKLNSYEFKSDIEKDVIIEGIKT